MPDGSPVRRTTCDGALTPVVVATDLKIVRIHQARPGHDAVRPGHDAVRPGHDAARPGHDAVRPGHDAVRPGHDAAHLDPTVPLRVAVAVLGTVAAVAYVAAGSVSVRVLALAGAALGGLIAGVVGLRVQRPRRRWPWVLLVAAQQAALVAVAIHALGGPSRWVIAVQAAAAVSAGCAVVGVLALVRSACGGRCDPAARVDGITVVIGVGTFCALEVSLPVLRDAEPLTMAAVAVAASPLGDLALLVALLQLGFTAALRLPAYRYLAGAVALLVTAHLADTWLLHHGITGCGVVFAAQCLAATTLLALAMLHPSMRLVGLARDDEGGADVGNRARRTWTAARMVLLVPALMLPVFLLVARPRGRSELLVIAVAGSAVLLLVLVRARAALLEAQWARACDTLTGLVTRDTFVSSLTGGSDSGRSRWVVLVDLDGHSHAVQFWGHATGDALVRQAAHRLRSALPAGALLARVGGDVFATVVEGDQDVAAEQSELMRLVAGAGLDLDGLELACSASVGLAPLAPDGDPLEALRDADTAMNVARSAGGDRVQVFEPWMREAIARRAALELALRYAAGEGELSVVYQPVVELPSGRVVGAEALLRWSNPEFGAVPPLEFVQIAEETGLIEDLGAWVLSQSCHRLACWEATGLVPSDFTMAVNVSTRQLRDGTLPDRVREVLRDTGLAPERIVLEVTESAMHEDQDAFVRVLRALRDVGVQIAVDDFGTGYSSLSYLSRLPVTSVKLDSSLVRDVAVPPGDAIARAVQGIAAALGLTVVAEGVEDDAQRVALSALGIAHAQGYLWGRPMPPKDFLALLAPPGELRVMPGAARRGTRREP